MGRSTSEATQRTDAPYVWPEALLRPASETLLVYLGQKDWINPAKAASGHDQGPLYQDALDVLCAANTSGRAVFRCRAHAFRRDLTNEERSAES
jgi:hypothetical protein